MKDRRPRKLKKVLKRRFEKSKQRQRENVLLTERIIYRKRQIRIKDPLMKLLRTWLNENILES